MPKIALHRYGRLYNKNPDTGEKDWPDDDVIKQKILQLLVRIYQFINGATIVPVDELAREDVVALLHVTLLGRKADGSPAFFDASLLVDRTVDEDDG